ncbi:hypothetical protein [Lignipirellula cremea]|uniref:Uncharacterized protein n=1 Tax=Lignipirellula cremea TaxID=2528010 RepID=A0A518E049_9BACT|nr:hypothetical protein [Lignipirellula cremea]QDU97459.1 hypothetical protein Pla8534_53070 [Lignipirellula cremea]
MSHRPPNYKPHYKGQARPTPGLPGQSSQQDFPPPAKRSFAILYVIAGLILGPPLLCGGCCGVLSLVSLVTTNEEERADKLWAEGKKEAAVEIYRSEIEVATFPSAHAINQLLAYYEAQGDRKESLRLLRLAAERDTDFSRDPIRSPELAVIFQQEQEQFKLKTAVAMARAQGTVRRRDDLAKLWYGHGSLHQKTALDWQQASVDDKLGTCADLLALTWMQKDLMPSIQEKIRSVNDLRPYAEELVAYVDQATVRLPDEAANRAKFGDMQVMMIVARGMEEKNWRIE